MRMLRLVLLARATAKTLAYVKFANNNATPIKETFKDKLRSLCIHNFKTNAITKCLCIFQMRCVVLHGIWKDVA